MRFRMQMRMARKAAFGLCVVLSVVANRAEAEVVRIRQAWSSSECKYGETDSLAAFRTADRGTLVFATAKEGNRIHVMDAASGRCLRDIGSPGSAEGELDYPNAVVVAKLPLPTGETVPVLLVVERDHRRVQAFSMDTFLPMGTFGADRLNLPYGGAVSYADGGPFLYVTDTKVKLTETVKKFRLKLDGSRIAGELVKSFGEETGPGTVRKAESVLVDDRHDRVFLCDESSNEVKVFTREGRFTGKTFGKGLIRREPEGLAMLVTGPDAGVIIVTDQEKRLSTWYAFDRETLEHRFTFTGDPVIANTDGICLLQEPFEGFPAGAFFAVHDDRDVRAYPLEPILKLAADSGK